MQQRSDQSGGAARESFRTDAALLALGMARLQICTRCGVLCNAVEERLVSVCCELENVRNLLLRVSDQIAVSLLKSLFFFSSNQRENAPWTPTRGRTVPAAP